MVEVEDVVLHLHDAPLGRVSLQRRPVAAAHAGAGAVLRQRVVEHPTAYLEQLRELPVPTAGAR